MGKCSNCGAPTEQQANFCSKCGASLLPLAIGRMIEDARRALDTNPDDHSARYNLALCRLRLAESKSNPDEKAGALKQAAGEILAVQGLSPDMGGENWYDRYQALLKNIREQSRRTP